jgi:hypothetical protein
MRAAFAALALLAASCRGPRPLTWTFHFAEPALRDRAVYVQATVLRGSCAAPRSAEPLYDQQVAVGGNGPRTPVLPDGAYCFRGAATDGACNVFARGEVDVALPLPNAGPIDVALAAATTETSECSGECRCGSCAPDGCDRPDARRDGG